jgi:hypothetical protein
MGIHSKIVNGPTKTQAKAAAEEVRKDALANLSNCHRSHAILQKGEINVDGRYTYHHHTGHDKSSGSKRDHEEKVKVHDEAKEVHWKCIQENEKGQ